MTPEEIKDRVKVKLKPGSEHETAESWARVFIVDNTVASDGMVRVAIGSDSSEGHWVSAEDAEELAVYFKKLAKKLRRAYPA